MGMGHPIAFKARGCGCVASLGSDITSNNPSDTFQKMRLMIEAQRHIEDEGQLGPRSWVAKRCAEVLEMATIRGAGAVGLKDIVGSITPGKRADLLITRCNSTRLSPVHDPLAALVFCANASDIDTVLIDGQMVKHRGRLTGIDWLKVGQELVQSAASIMERPKKAPREHLETAVSALL